MKLSQKGINNNNWKGENIGKNYKHDWVKRFKSKSNFCEICNKKVKRIELANIKNHQYTRNPDDYKWLCRSCHIRLDYPNGLIGINLK